MHWDDALHGHWHVHWNGDGPVHHYVALLWHWEGVVNHHLPFLDRLWLGP